MSKKDLGGRPLKSIDWVLVEKLCAIQCTKDEICSVIEVDEKTLTKHCLIDNSMSYSDFFRQKKSKGKISLRRSQWKLATETLNPTMLIWLGKQFLNQSDKNDIKTTQEIKVNIDSDDSDL